MKRFWDLLGDAKSDDDFALEDFEILSNFLSLRKFKAGETIFKEGDQGESLLLLVEGDVHISKEFVELHETVGVDLKNGAFFGEMSFLDGAPRSAGATACTDVSILELTRKNLSLMAAEHPAVTIKLLLRLSSILSRRLRQTTGRFVSLAS